MKQLRIIATVLVSIVVALGLLATPASAHSEGPATECVSGGLGSRSWGYACFQPWGDDIWSQDGAKDGWGVTVEVKQENYWCTNTHGAYRWHECDNNYWEWECIQFRYARWKGGFTQDWTPWSGRISARTGDNC